VHLVLDVPLICLLVRPYHALGEMDEEIVELPVAPTSALPLKLDLPGMHEGLYHPLPCFYAVPESSLPNVTFVHSRQYNRIIQRRLYKVLVTAKRKQLSSQVTL
jgi:hypothetical protein